MHFVLTTITGSTILATSTTIATSTAITTATTVTKANGPKVKISGTIEMLN